MRRSSRGWQLGVGLAICLVLLLAGLVAARSSGAAQGGYDLPWWTVDGGGATFSTGPGYSLGGTVGQPDAGVQSGGGYILGGGFWMGGAVVAATYSIYLPLVLRGYP